MKIFLGFGKNKTIKDELCSFLKEIGHETIILEDQSNIGSMTVIEKLENNKKVDKAIMILTGDDTIKPFGCHNINKFPRQNVIFELGYFVALLGRRNVLVIVDNKERLKLLTDFSVCYTKYSRKNNKWKTELIKSLKGN